MTTIREKLGLPADATDEQVATELDIRLAAAQPAPAPALATAVLTEDAVAAAVERVLSRRSQNDAHANACVTAVERFISEGKIAPASRAAAIRACGKDAAALTAAVEYWTTQPKIIGDVQHTGAPGAGATPRLTEVQALMCKAAGITAEQFLAQGDN